MNYVYLPKVKRTIFLDHIQQIIWNTPMIAFTDCRCQKLCDEDAQVLAEALKTSEEAFLPYDDEASQNNRIDYNGIFKEVDKITLYINKIFLSVSVIDKTFKSETTNINEILKQFEDKLFELEQLKVLLSWCISREPSKVLFREEKCDDDETEEHF